jgi:hypothetical protein
MHRLPLPSCFVLSILPIAVQYILHVILRIIGQTKTLFTSTFWPGRNMMSAFFCQSIIREDRRLLRLELRIEPQIEAKQNESN